MNVYVLGVDFLTTIALRDAKATQGRSTKGEVDQPCFESLSQASRLGKVRTSAHISSRSSLTPAMHTLL